ncbi:MAG: tyrosine-protein phosphatase [Pseudomonadota bacterium]
MMILDHGFLRLWWMNLHEIDDGVWRANQPSPRQLRQIVKRTGIKTVINLRGWSTWGSYVLERKACAELGIKMIDCKLYSRRPPAAEEVKMLFKLFDQVERPFLMHCKSGADRAGMGSALYMLWKQSPPEEAVRQLSWDYLHFKHAQTGILDEFVAEYARAHEKTGISFPQWLDTTYDKKALIDNFKPSHMANWIVDRVLNRE